jgi:hypothetical protein
MGLVMVKCPATGRVNSTGIEMDAARFRRTPVFFGRSYCPACRVEHEWFAADAWVEEPARALDGVAPQARSTAVGRQAISRSAAGPARLDSHRRRANSR